jgi:hypothetical protein
MMTRFVHVVRAAAACAVALVLAASPAAAQGNESASKPTVAAIAHKTHHLILQVNTGDDESGAQQRDQRRAILQDSR